MTLTTTTQEDEFQKALNEIEQTNKMVAQLMKTPHYSRMGEIGIFTIVQKAKSIGLNPLDALNGAIYFVNGKVELSANTMNYLIRAQGHSITKDETSNNEICILHGKRKDNGDTWTSSFSISEAKKAGIYKNVWEKYPEDLLFARALTRLARQLFPDVCKGAYIEGEIQVTQASYVVDEVKPQVITVEQALELEEILDFDEDYKASVVKRLNDMGFSYLHELTPDLYAKVLKAAKEKVKELQAKEMLAIQMQSGQTQINAQDTEQ